MLKIDLDFSDLEDLLDLEDKVIDATKEASETLAKAVYGKIVELADEKLNTTRDPYIDALSIFEESEGVWIIALDGKMSWREDGLPPHNQLDDLLKGKTHRAIPIEQNKPNSGANSALVKAIKAELGKINVPFSKIETDKGGKPKLGTLHRINISRSPVMKASSGGQNNSLNPMLRAVTVSQKLTKDKTGKESVKRAITTFTMASESQRNTGKWDHPGVEPANLFDQAEEWTLEHYEDVILPKIMEKIIESL